MERESWGGVGIGGVTSDDADHIVGFSDFEVLLGELVVVVVTVQTRFDSQERLSERCCCCFYVMSD
jgi:hypothetical protein